MLDYFRKHAKSRAVKAFYIVISLTFIAGFGGLLSRSSCGGEPTDPNTVATVGGKPIHLREVQMAADRLRERIEAQMGGNVDPKMLKMFRIQTQAVEQLVDEALLLEGARQSKIRISDEEVVNAIKGSRFFARDDGTFSKEKYHSLLKSNGLNPASYEEDERRRLSLVRFQNLALATAVVSDAAAEEHYRLQNERVELSYLSFDPAKLESGIGAPDAAALQSFFEAHRDQFKAPARVKVAFLTVDPKAIEPDVKIEEDDVRARYERDSKRYEQPETVSAHHILIAVKADANDEEVELAKAKAEDILARLKAGGDFAEEAKRSSDDPSNKERGGDLGSFPKGRMAKPFEDAAFGATVGELVGPVRTQFGFHVIRVDRHDPGRTVPLDEVQDSIRRTLVTEKALKLAEARANALRKEILERGASSDWKAIAEERKLASGEGGPAASGEPIDGARQLTDAALKVKLGEWTEAVRTGKGFQLAKVLEREEERPLTLDEARDAVVQAYKKDQAIANARASAESARQKLATGASIESVASELGTAVESTGPMALTSPSVPGLGTDPAVVGEAQKLDESHRVAAQPVEAGGKIVVLAFGKRSLADGGDPTKHKEGVEAAKRQMEAEQQQLVHRALVERLKTQIPVSYNAELMKQLAED